jgi:hypothetical protein
VHDQGGLCGWTEVYCVRLLLYFGIFFVQRNWVIFPCTGPIVMGLRTSDFGLEIPVYLCMIQLLVLLFIVLSS